MEYLLRVATVAFLVALQVTISHACNGYELVVNRLSACKQAASSVTLTNFTVSLSDDCKLVPSGCIAYAAYNNVTMKYLIKKRNDLMPPYVFEGRAEGCKDKTKIHADALAIMVALKVPTTCPVVADKICSEKNIFADVSKYMKYLPKADGRTIGQIDLIFNGGVSCFKFDFVIQKKKKPTMKK